MSKQVAFKRPAEPEAWVKGVDPKVRCDLKRFSVDLPTDLHMQIKMTCVARGETMSEAVTRALEAAFPRDDVNTT